MSCNIIGEYVNFSKSCLKRYVKRIMDKHFNQDIFDQLAKYYIDARYYNACKTIKKDFDYNVIFCLYEQLPILKEKSDDPKKMETTFKIFKFLLYFDNVRECSSINEIIKELESFRINEFKIVNDKKFNSDIFEMVRNDLTQKKAFIEKFQSKNFSIDYFLTNIENVYDSVLKHNLKFPSIYNENAINKIFDSKEIAEKKLVVEYSFVATKILLDVIKGDFKKQYLVDYSINLNNKKINLKRLFKIIDNDIVKEKLIIKINYSDFIKNKEWFYSNMRLGYKYAIILDETFIDEENNIKLLEIFKYIITSKQSEYYKKYSHLKNIIVLR